MAFGGVIVLSGFIVGDDGNGHQHQKSQKHGHIKNCNYHFGMIYLVFPISLLSRSFAVLNSYMPNAIPAERFFLKKITIN